MLLLKVSTGVHWFDEFPYAPKLGGRLEGMSLVTINNLFESGFKTNLSQSSRVIELRMKVFGSEGNFPFAFR